MTSRTRLVIANGLILLGLIPTLIWLALFGLAVTPGAPLLPWVAAGVPRLYIPLLLLSAVIAGPATAYAYRDARLENHRWSFASRWPMRVALVMFVLAFFCLVAFFAFGAVRTSLRLGLPQEFADDLRQHDGLDDPTLLNGKVNIGSGMVWDLTFMLTCADDPPADFGRTWMTFLDGVGFRVADTALNSRTGASKVRSLSIVSIDSARRQIDVFAALADKRDVSIGLVSAPPTRHDETLEKSLLGFSSGFTGCEVGNVVRNDNGRSAGAKFDESAAEQVKIINQHAAAESPN